MDKRWNLIPILVFSLLPPAFVWYLNKDASMSLCQQKKVEVMKLIPSGTFGCAAILLFLLRQVADAYDKYKDAIQPHRSQAPYYKCLGVLLIVLILSCTMTALFSISFVTNPIPHLFEISLALVSVVTSLLTFTVILYGILLFKPSLVV